MKHNRITLRRLIPTEMVLLLAVVFAANVAADDGNAVLGSAAGEQEVFAATVRSIFDTYSETIGRGDADGWIALWDEDGVQLPPDHPMVVGRAAIDRRARPDFTEPFPGFQIDVKETMAFGDYGFARGVYTFPLEGSGEWAVFEGKYLTVFHRQEDGAWKIYRDCFSSNSAPSGPAAAAVQDSTETTAVRVPVRLEGEPRDTEAILRLWENYAAGITNADLDLWLSTIDDECIKMPSNTYEVFGKVVIGKKRLRAQEAMAGRMKIDCREVIVAGDWALSSGAYTLQVTSLADGQSRLIDGKFLDILRRNADGTWRIYRDTFNSNVPIS